MSEISTDNPALAAPVVTKVDSSYCAIAASCCCYLLEQVLKQ